MNRWCPVAVAAASLFSCAAAVAQTTQVTIAGVVDAAVRRVSNSGGGLTTLQSGQNSTSRMWFTGTEDLGGGYFAGFWLEGTLFADTGVAGSPQYFDRQSTVRVGGPFGELRLGRDWTPVFSAYAPMDPWVFVSVATMGNLLSPTNTVAFARAFPAGLTTLSRSSNSIEYFLPPNLGGLYAHAQVGFSEKSNASGYFDYRSARLGWRGGPVDVAGFFGNTKIDATNATHKQRGVALAWTVGTVRLTSTWVDTSYLGSKSRNLLLGASVPVGPWTLRASYNRADQSGVGIAPNSRIDADDANQWAFGAVYNLSRRTALYGTFARITNKGNARFSIAGGQGLTAAGTSNHGYEVGMRHAF